MLRVTVYVIAVLGFTLANVTVNKVFDSGLNHINIAINYDGWARPPISNLNENFTYKGQIIELHCWNGYVGDLSSLQRTGDVNVISENKGDRVSLQTTLALSHFDAHYEHCQFLRESEYIANQGLDTTITSNTIELQVTFKKIDNRKSMILENCSTSVDYMRFKEWGDVHIDNDANPIHYLENLFAKWMKKKLEDEIIGLIKEKLQQEFNETMAVSIPCHMILYELH